MTEPSLLDTFQRLCDDWNEAIVANDAERIGAFATPGWTFVSQDGIFAGSQFLESVADGTVSHDSMRSTVVSAVDVGGVVIVVARVLNTGAFRGEPFENDEWTSDVFVRRDDRWLCELTHLTTARASTA